MLVRRGRGAAFSEWPTRGPSWPKWLDRWPPLLVSTFIVVTSIGSTACAVAPSQSPLDDGSAFSGERALQRLEGLMKRSRALGDPSRREAIEDLAHGLTRAGAEVTLDAFEASLAAVPGPVERTYPLTNIYARFRRDRPPEFVLATHFDTRPWADEEPDARLHDQPVPGANDGTSGVAVLLELATLLEAQLPPEAGFVVILFDGEELGQPGRGGYCAGSRRFAARVAATDTRDPIVAATAEHAEFGIVLDMVGDRDLDLRRETFSREANTKLLAAIWATARHLGIAAFQDEDGRRILDDHVFLTEAGIPSVLLIDDRYPYWHTRDDTLDKVSAASLGAVGEVLRRTLLDAFSPGNHAERGNGR